MDPGPNPGSNQVVHKLSMLKSLFSFLNGIRSSKRLPVTKQSWAQYKLSSNSGNCSKNHTSQYGTEPLLMVQQGHQSQSCPGADGRSQELHPPGCKVAPGSAKEKQSRRVHRARSAWTLEVTDTDPALTSSRECILPQDQSRKKAQTPALPLSPP